MKSINESIAIINKMPLSKFSDEELQAISICVKAAKVADYMASSYVQSFGYENTILSIHDFLEENHMPNDVLEALGFDDAEVVIEADKNGDYEK